MESKNKSMFGMGTRFMSLVLVIMMVITGLSGVFPTTSVSATDAATTATPWVRRVCFGGYDNSSGAGRKTWHSDLTFMNGWSEGRGSGIAIYAFTESGGRRIAYCIEPGVSDVECKHTQQTIGTMSTNLNKAQSDGEGAALTGSQIYTLLGYLFATDTAYTGYVQDGWEDVGYSDSSRTVASAQALLSQDTYLDLCKVHATQLLVWEIIVGERDANFNYVTSTATNKVTDVIPDSHPWHNKIMEYYDKIVEEVQAIIAAATISSPFSATTASATTYKLDYDSSTKTYSTTISTSADLSNYTLTSGDSSVTVTKVSSGIKITSSKPITSTVTITATSSYKKAGLVWWGDASDGYSQTSDEQDLAMCDTVSTSTATGYLKVTTGTGTVQFQKTDESGSYLNGATFTLAPTNYSGSTLTSSQGSAGVISFSNVPYGTYTLKETSAPAGYTASGDTWTVVVNSSGTTITSDSSGETVTMIANEANSGSISVKKTITGTSASSVTKNNTFTFTLSGTSDGGEAVNKTATITGAGTATFTNVPVGTYTITETCDNKLWTAKTETVTVTAKSNQTVEVEFTNAVNTGTISVQKAISGLGSSFVTKNNTFTFTLSGTSDLGIAVNKTVTITGAGTETFDDVPIGTYTITETCDSLLWAPVTKTVTVTADSNETVSVKFTNRVNEGNLKVVKVTSGTGSSSVTTNNVFTFTLSGTSDFGSSVNETVTITGSGSATFEDIPVGTYTLTETCNNALWTTKTKTVTVTVSSDTTETVEFENTVNTGTIKVEKAISGASSTSITKNNTFTFTLSGTSDLGIPVNKTVTIKGAGSATFDDVPVGTYTITETCEDDDLWTPVTKTVTVTATSDETVSVSFTNAVNVGSLKVVKTISGTDSATQNNTFTFTLSGTSDLGIAVNETVTITGAGSATFENIPYGTYTLTETCNNSLWTAKTETVTVAVNSNTVKTVEFTNAVNTGSVQVKKTTTGTSASSVTKNNVFTFTLSGTSDLGTEVNETKTITGAGTATFTDIPVGTYTLTETCSDSLWTAKTETVTVTVSSNETYEVEFENTVNTGTLKVKKTTTGTGVSGVTKNNVFTFTLTGTSDLGIPVSKEVTITGAGTATFDDVPVGTYTLTETCNNSLWTAKTKTVEVTVTSNSTETVEFTNTVNVGSISVEKVTSGADGVTTNNTFTFTLSGTSDLGIAVNETKTITGAGTATFTNIPVGTYTLTETCDNKLWTAKTETVTVTVGSNETKSVTFENSVDTGSISVEKITSGADADKVTANNTFTFTLTGTSDLGIAVNESVEITGPDTATFENIPVGTYTLTETCDNSLWTPVTKTVTVTVESGKTESVTFENVVSTGSVEIYKSVTDESGTVTSPEGFVFKIEGTTNLGVEYSATAVTDADGKILFDDLQPGTYTVTEIGTPDYPDGIPSWWDVEGPWTVTVVAGKATTVYANNTNKVGELTVTKTSEDGFVEGVTFRLYGYSTSGNYVNLYAVTDANGVATFSDVLVGTEYTLEEVDTAEWYIVPVAQSTQVVWDDLTEYEMYNELKRGDVSVTKTSEDGFVEGVEFRLYGTSDSGETIDLTATTDASGVATFEDVLIGTYTIEETNTKDWYIVPAAQSVTVIWNDVVETEFYNELKRGDLEITKTSEDGLVEGVTFRLYGTSDSGAAVDVTAVTDANGVAKFSDILIGTYTIEEVDTAIRYVVPDTQSVTILWNETVGASVSNILKKWTATVTKTDSETGDAQGDASLAGAVYGVYDGDELVDTYVTDENGQFTTKEYVCGDNWSIREITPSEGYLLDETVYHVGAEAKLFTVEHNAVTVDVTEEIIKGQISIIKHTDDGSTQIETPEEGAIFEIYLATAGSYEDAEESERAILVCDENGYAETPLLPYGTYIVHQVSGWEGRELMSDFEVYISEDGKTYHYLINNSNFESYIKVVKTDAETGEQVAYAGAAFQIYDPNGELVTMTYTYPSVTVIDTFYTNSEGYLITPETVPYGEGYTLVEVEAPYGYVLDSTPVSFDVKESESKAEDGITVIEVVRSNYAQKGTITVYKYGEVFSSVEESDDTYQPVYEVEGLAGATYEIYAAEDVYTLDGTLRYAEGELVDTITTDETGSATSKELYLGKYTVVEVEAPYGYVLNETEASVELVYAGQEVEVTSTSTSFTNDRQKLALSLTKDMEVDTLFEIGMNDEITSVQFGLYAAEDIVASDGSMIPEDGLIEAVYVSADGTLEFASDLPFGSYYVKEIATDEHYILSDVEYHVTFSYEGQNVSLVSGAINDGEDIKNEIIYGSVLGKKINEYGDSLEGAVIGLFAENETDFIADNAYMVVTTAEDGSFAFENVPYGTYVVREIEQPEGYVLNDVSYIVTVSYDGQVIDVEIVNEFERGNVVVEKVSEDGNASGITFRLYGVSTTGYTVDLTAVTDENGVAVFEDVLVGTDYTIEEVDTADYYIEPDAQNITVTWNGETEVDMYNELKRGDVSVTKTSEDGFVEGITFRLYGTSDSGEYVDLTAVTNENGVANFKDVLIGTYTLEEVDTASYYVEPSAQSVTVIWDEVVEAEFYNELKRGDVIVTKASEDDMVEGVMFRLYGTSDSGTEVDLIATTDENGVAAFSDVLIGTYTIEEVGTASYYIEPEAQNITVIWDDEVEVDMYNELKRGDVKVVKTSEDDVIEGVEFHLYGTSDAGIYVDLYATTDENGVVSFEDVLIGNYTIEEVDTPSYYIEPDAQSATVIWDEAVEVSFYNELKKGILVVTKTAEDEIVEGRTFHLYGVSDSGLEVDMYATTDENGVAMFEDVLIGIEYTIEEVDVPDYYITPAEQTINIFWNQQSNAQFYNDLKRGTVTVAKTSEDGIVEGRVFHLTGTSDSGKSVDLYAYTDANGIATFEDVLIGSDYILEEVGLESYYVVPDAQTISVDWNATTVTAFYNELARGDVVVRKTSEDGCVEGIAFRLYGVADNGETVDLTAVTDENGIASFEGILVGDYTIDEIDAASYYIETEAQSVTVVMDETAEVSFYNELKRGDVIVTKTSEDNVVEGVEFRLYGTSDSGAEVDLTAVTDENGVAVFEDVLIGTYTIEEVDTASYYVEPEAQSVIVEWNETAKAEFHNELKRGSVVVVKTAEDNVVWDVTFHLYGVADNGEYVDLYATTDMNGVVSFEDVLIGTYTIEEVDTASYYIEPEAQDIIVEWNETAKVEFYNELKRGSVVVTKTSEDGLVTGIRFHLHGRSDSGALVVAYAYTNSDGIAIFSDLPIGTYVIEEADTPVQYVVLDEQDVTIEWNETTDVSFYNELIRGNVILTKVDEDYPDNKLSGAEFEVYLDSNANGELDDEDELVGTLDETSEGVYEMFDLPYGQYFVVETVAPEGYVLDEGVYEFFISEDGQTYVIENDFGEGNFVNTIIRGNVILTKVDEDYPDNKLSGAEFEVYFDSNDNGELDDEDELVGTLDETSEGVYEMFDLPYGQYFVVETVAPEGYVLDEGVYEFFISEDGQTYVIENDFGEGNFVNTIIRGNVILTKVDEDYPDNKLSGAEFEVYFDSNDNGELDDEDKLVGTLDETSEGVYEMFDLPYGQYFVIETEAPEGYVLDEGVYEFFISEDGQTYVVENDFGTGNFVNVLGTGSIKIVKTSSDGNVEGFAFRVTGPNGYDEVFYTDANGVILIEGLEPGEYTVSEVLDSTSMSYILADDETVTVESGETSVVSMYNTLRETPKTGDDGTFYLWCALAMAAVIWFAVIGMLGVRKKMSGRAEHKD